MAPKTRKYQVIKTDLDEVLVKLKDEDIDVDQAIKLYEKGQKLISEMQSYLKTARNSIKEIKVKNKAK
ncbi:MAG TPA: exodeoxyribonuclease VII small subunit [Candidatus Sulfotelmatobacter sp.]|nr:exodeoxyribonuclease VII small subunit [Candidatus Sulfotelmatobacter sp.]